ncbi:MAG: hypothetical protein AB7O59_03930 [Pirellulales bacterium]
MPSRPPRSLPQLAPRILLAVSCCLVALRADAEDLGIRVPEGFEVSLYADDALAHDIFSMTVDAQGRVVVAGLGYVKTLHDDNADGRADRATLFSSVPASGAHGMYFDGPDLICTGDNAVMRQRDTDGDGAADGQPEIWTALRHPEHGANGIARGPDGCYYVICGNDAGVSAAQITTAGSPVQNPRCGGVVRLSAAGKPLDIYAHGFRNPYDLDFDASGHMFTVDADGERDHHLPWYAPTRLFDIAQGREHGWLLMGWTRGWNRPPSFFDSVERAVEIGRGSPTGLTVYRHRAFGEHYRGGVFSACWSLGRVYFMPLTKAGATCTATLETFAETTGDAGFAPCDLAVGPAGEMYIAIGGRRTRGSVFCIRRVDTDKPTQPRAGEPLDLVDVLRADQPLASWSRARWLPAARRIGAEAFQGAAENGSLSMEERVRAIEIVVELGGPLDTAWAQRLAVSDRPEIRARVAWALAGAEPSSRRQIILEQLTAYDDPAVQRAAWEALARSERLDPQYSPDWSRGLSSPERRVRAAAIQVARRAGADSYHHWQATVRLAAGSAESWRCRLADLWIRLPDSAELKAPPFTADDLQNCLACFVAGQSDAALALEAVRLIQIGLGDLRTQAGQAEVYSGYVGNLSAHCDDATLRSLAAQLAPAFPTADAELNRELARLLGMLGAADDKLPAAIAGQWTDRSTVEDDVHYLIVASLLPGSRSAEVTAATATALARLHGKLDRLEQFASRNWPLRVNEAFGELCRRDPALAEALVACPEFGHREHTLFAEHLTRPLRQVAARKLWSAQAARDDEPTSELVALVARLPAEESRPMLLALWEHPGLRDAVVLALAKNPLAADRALFIEGLSSPQAGVVERAAGALVALGVNCKTAEMAAALRALKQACGDVKQPQPRRSLVRLLNFWTEENSDVEEDPNPAQVWVGWYQLFANYYPAAAAELARSSTSDAAGWRKRLADVDWQTGDAARGRIVFERRACHRCHEQSGHLGPDLKGVGTRFSRDDLFTAIVDPNLEVAPTYQTTLIATEAGQVYHGLIVYESPEITLLQTGPDTTVRITNSDQSSQRRSNQSLMPTGLLEPLSDPELSDLYAYLRTIGAR